MASITRIPLRVLEHLEADCYEALPAPVFVRGYIRSYARVLRIDPEPLLRLYGARNTETPAAPITAIRPAERPQRFGFAVAIVVLLILFTLALSVVLRPRQAIEGQELSLTPVRVLRDAALQRLA